MMQLKHLTTLSLVPEASTGRSESFRKREGMTIVESMVALVILALFITGTCQLLMSHRQVSDMARGHYTAINIAKNRMELVRTFDFDQVHNFQENNMVVDSSGLADPDGLYRRSTEFSPVGANNNLIELTVTVDIRNRQTLQFNPANEVLKTYFAKYLASEASSGPTP